MAQEKIRKDLNAIIVESIKIATEKSRYGGKKRGFIKINLKNGKTIDCPIDMDNIDLISALNEYTGGAIKTKELVDEISEKDGETKIYTCVKLTLTNGSEIRAFPSFNHLTVIEVYYNFLKQQAKKQV